MTFYVAAYDTEAIYPWWELGNTPYSATTYQQAVSYEGTRLDECLDGVRAVADVHLRHRAPATFFIVAQLAEAAGPRLREILDHDLFDLQSHSFTHDNMVAIRDDAAAVRRELVDSKRVIEDLFEREVIGFTAPGGFAHGFLGETRLLEALWEAGYRYVRTLSWQANHVAPAPLTQPFWFSDDGYPELLEISAHAWHDNILTGQPSAVAWPPALPWDYPARLPTSGREVYQAYAPGIEYARDQGLMTYAPCFHPWSIYRVDRGAAQIDLLLEHAQRAGLTLASCSDVYRHLTAQPQLAHPAPNISTLPKAWRALLEKPDSSLLELLANKYEELNGYKPDLDSCRKFLTQSSVITTESTRIGPQVTLPQSPERDPRRISDPTLIKLSEFSPEMSKRPRPPKSLLCPDRTEHNITKWYELFVKAAEWLISKGMVTAEECPIYVTQGKRYHIHHTPKQKDESPFYLSSKLSNGLHLNRPTDSEALVRLSKSLLKKFDQDPSQFFVRLR